MALSKNIFVIINPTECSSVDTMILLTNLEKGGTLYDKRTVKKITSFKQKSERVKRKNGRIQQTGRRTS